MSGSIINVPTSSGSLALWIQLNPRRGHRRAGLAFVDEFS
jgi:hypothetical protein